jgi:very-short-patch-repair endonuclease
MNKYGIIKNQRVSKRKIELSRKMRKNTTIAERLLWNEVRNRKLMNMKFRRQQVIDGVVVDFYCDELKLCIEIDGEIHNTEENRHYDEQREEILRSRGLHVLRFSNDEVLQDINNVLKRIVDYAK